MNIHLVRDRDTANSPLVGESAVNRTNIHNAIKLMNLVHFTVKEYMNDTVRKSLRNTESPFYVDSDGELQVSNGMALIGMDTTIAQRSTLNQLLSDARSASSIS